VQLQKIEFGKSMIKQGLQYFKIYQKYVGARLYIVFVLSGLAAVVEVLGVAMILPLLGVLDVGVGAESAEQNSSSQFLARICDRLGIGDSVLAILVFIAMLFFLKGIILYVAFAYQAYLKAELMGEMKQRIYDKMAVMDYSYYMKKNTGHFVNILTSQITGMVHSFDKFKEFLSRILATVIILLGAVLFSWKFASMALALGLLCLILFRKLNRKVYLVSLKAVNEHSELNKYLVQMIQSFKYLISTNQLSPLRNEVVKSTNKLVSYKKTQGYAQSLTVALMEPIAITLVLMIVGFYITFLKEPVFPILVSLALFYRAMGGMLNIQESWQSTLNRIGSLEVIDKELLKLEKNREVSGDRPIGPLSDSIAIQNVTFHYRKKKKLRF
jgi:ABC-type multidrug transport system fused ATPase/permease subunit